MLNESAPPGKQLKYARPEHERRFLLAAPPQQPSIRDVLITDRYIVGTRLRLRRMVDAAGEQPATIYKLTQKVPAAGGGPGLITNIYLDASEYEVLSILPADTLRKTRHSIPPFGVDEFRGHLAGLCLAEVEFGGEEEADAFHPPAFVIAEVTDDVRFTGGFLVTATREDVATGLAEFGLDLKA